MRYVYVSTQFSRLKDGIYNTGQRAGYTRNIFFGQYLFVTLFVIISSGGSDYSNEHVQIVCFPVD